MVKPREVKAPAVFLSLALAKILHIHLPTSLQILVCRFTCCSDCKEFAFHGEASSLPKAMLRILGKRLSSCI